MMVIMAEACQEQSVNGIPMTSSCYPCVTAVTYLVRGRPLCAQELINEVISEQQRAREESEKKLNLLIRRLDHLERARRELETPLLEAKYAEQARAGPPAGRMGPCAF